MNLEKLKEAVQFDLFATANDRRASSKEWPDAPPSKFGVGIAAIESIVEDVLMYHGYYRIDPIFDPQRGRLTYGQVTDTGSVDYLRITWDQETLSFNPLKHIERVEMPPADRRYVEGFSYGLE